MDAKYETIAINNTPQIDSGDTIAIDLYWSGGGVPDESRLHIVYNQSLVDQDDPEEVRTFVQKSIDKEADVVRPVSGEPYKQIQEIMLPATSVGLVETVFYPDPRMGQSVEVDQLQVSGVDQPRVSERHHDSHPPVEVRINTFNCPPGEYRIPIILSYKANNNILQNREEVELHVRSWWERNRTVLEVIGVIDVVISIGIFAFSSGIVSL